MCIRKRFLSHPFSSKTPKTTPHHFSHHRTSTTIFSLHYLLLRCNWHLFLVIHNVYALFTFYVQAEVEVMIMAKVEHHWTLLRLLCCLAEWKFLLNRFNGSHTAFKFAICTTASNQFRSEAPFGTTLRWHFSDVSDSINKNLFCFSPSVTQEKRMKYLISFSRDWDMNESESEEEWEGWEESSSQ